MTARHLLLPKFVTAIFASLTLAASTAHAADCTAANLLPALASSPTAKAATLCLLNHERESRGLLPLAEQPVLASAAQSYSQAMVAQRFFGHVSPAGQTLEDRLASYVGTTGIWSTGEILAWGVGPLATPAAIVRNWMSSTGHRDNILNPAFNEVGVGIADGSPQGGLPAVSATYVSKLGARGSAAAAPPAALRASPPAALRAAPPDALRAAPPAALRASASSAPRPVAKRVSAKTRKQISKRCHRTAGRTKGTRKARTARYDRCVSKALRAAAR